MTARGLRLVVMVLLLGLLAGCPRAWQAAQMAPELASAGGAAGRSVEVPGSSIEDIARATRTSPTLVEDVAQTGGSTQRWRQFGVTLRDANARTQGPVRDAVVETACEYLRGEDAATTLSSELGERGIAVSGPKYRALLVDTFSLGQELRSASVSFDQQERVAVALLCYAAMVSG